VDTDELAIEREDCSARVAAAGVGMLREVARAHDGDMGAERGRPDINQAHLVSRARGGGDPKSCDYDCAKTEARNVSCRAEIEETRRLRSINALHDHNAILLVNRADAEAIVVGCRLRPGRRASVTEMADRGRPIVRCCESDRLADEDRTANRHPLTIVDAHDSSVEELEGLFASQTRREGLEKRGVVPAAAVRRTCERRNRLPVGVRWASMKG
jgi:hypothetical protein